MILSFVRRVLFIPGPRIDAKRALLIAREECLKRGISMGNYEVVEGLKTWKVWVDDWRGSPYLLIDQQTGEIVKFASLPR